MKNYNEEGQRTFGSGQDIRFNFSNCVIIA